MFFFNETGKSISITEQEEKKVNSSDGKYRKSFLVWELPNVENLIRKQFLKELGYKIWQKNMAEESGRSSCGWSQGPCPILARKLEEDTKLSKLLGMVLKQHNIEYIFYSLLFGFFFSQNTLYINIYF